MQEDRRSINGPGLEVSARDVLNCTPRPNEEAPTTAGYKHDDEKFVAEVKTGPAGWKDSEITFPDGGWRAWMVVAGAMSCTFSTFGFANTWGVFQSYYETDLLRDTSPSTIAWIGSIQYALVFIPGVITGRLVDLGYFRVPFSVGTTFVVIATFLIAQCTKYWQFFLCQGIFLGLGAGICFGATLPVVGHWFSKKRGLALGLTALGSSCGGTVYPIAARQLIPRVGFPWTIRILGFMIVATLGFSNLTLARRLPPKNMPGGIFNVRVFRSLAFTVYCLSAFVCFLGIYTVLTYIDVAATRIGISPDFSFYLVSIANASAGPSRVICGVLADRFGAVNVISSLIAIAVLYGLSNAAFVSSFNMPLYEMGEMGDVGRRIGTVMMFSAVGGLVGPPISGAILNRTGGLEASVFPCYAPSLGFCSWDARVSSALYLDQRER
ncbi:hypothetical protein NMY22_g9234 [Coprinellus aureogranulatus]|nr:hypothetical protein NMY22_g9234 [Coprinellus aureogranulatus]